MINDCLKSLRINPGNLPNRSFAKKDGGSRMVPATTASLRVSGTGEAVSGIDSRNLSRQAGLQAALSSGMAAMA